MIIILLCNWARYPQALFPICGIMKNGAQTSSAVYRELSVSMWRLLYWLDQRNEFSCRGSQDCWTAVSPGSAATCLLRSLPVCIKLM